ncbi:hypothetical protein EVG80_15190 [Salmonella enterica subsp. enterica serovar Mississippi]|nr:hypothetical protein [Salmonella enterica subsp. enterica serovar Mississippi]
MKITDELTTSDLEFIWGGLSDAIDYVNGEKKVDKYFTLHSTDKFTSILIYGDEDLAQYNEVACNVEILQRFKMRNFRGILVKIDDVYHGYPVWVIKWGNLYFEMLGVATETDSGMDVFTSEEEGLQAWEYCTFGM